MGALHATPLRTPASHTFAKAGRILTRAGFHVLKNQVTTLNIVMDNRHGIGTIPAGGRVAP
ncbi:MAG: hypothetical protein D9N14_17140 [Ketobacter sp.]|nr:MAG: hypothetical protein D9N14_17140 [Ketobacter sp.]